MKFPAFEAIDLKNKIEPLGIVELLLTQVIPDANQPRKNFAPQALEELAASIKQHGVIQPIIVKQESNERYQIIAGERRWRAAQLAGLQIIPAIVQTNDMQKNIAVSLIENIQREELNSIELAEAFYQLNMHYALSHEAIGAMVGKSRVTVTNLLRLLNLSSEVRHLLINGELEIGHARALLTLPNAQQNSLAQKIVEKKLTVRAAEKLAQSHKLPKEKKSFPYSKEVDQWTQQLSNRFSTQVSININEKGEGKIVIHFSSPDEINSFIEQLKAR